MSAAATTDDGWTTVMHHRTPRPAFLESTLPPRASAGRAASSSTSAPPPKPGSWRAARPAGAVAAATTKNAPLPDTRSLTDFPALGPATSAAALPVRSNAMNWSRTVAESTTRAEAEEAASARAATAAALLSSRESAERAAIRARQARLAAIGTRCFDDGPVDHDAPEEGGYEEDDGFGPSGTPIVPPGDDDEYAEEDAGELNANLARVRRAGDHSDW